MDGAQGCFANDASGFDAVKPCVALNIAKLLWRKAGQPRHLVDAVDSDQEVVNKELSLSLSLAHHFHRAVQGNLAHKKTPTPLGPP